MFKLMQKRIVGLDCDDAFVAAAELTKKMNQILLGRCITVSNLKELTGNPLFKDAEVIVNLPSQAILFRSFHLSPSFFKSKNKEKDILKFLQHQNLPFKLEECFWDTFIMDSNLNFIAAKKEAVERYISAVQESGLNCAGVIPSLIALYNVFIYNYPERKNNTSVILNIRNSASDLLIYEANRLWIYPLSIGRIFLKDTPDAFTKFSQEVQRIFNAHYLHSPALTRNTVNYLYLCGQESSDALIASLKQGLGDFEITALDPLKNMAAGTNAVSQKQVMALSLGLGLTGLGAPHGLNINLIKGKIRKEKSTATFNLLKNFSFISLIAVSCVLLLLGINLFNSLKQELAFYRKTQYQITSILPQIKTLKEEKEKVLKSLGYLESKIHQQKLYLVALAAISESKPASLLVNEFDAQIKDAKLNVVLSGSSPAYEDINQFLTNLKKNESVKEAKVLASTFPTAADDKVKAIDFKLRFELE